MTLLFIPTQWRRSNASIDTEEIMTSLHPMYCHLFLLVELVTLDLPSPFVGAGLNRDSLIASYERVLTAHPNIQLVILGKLIEC